MKKATLNLETLTCPTCMAKIEGAVGGLKGVENVNVMFNSSKAKVDFDENQIDVETIANTIQNLGYDVLKTKVS